jgi:hypothetical protein
MENYNEIINLFDRPKEYDEARATKMHSLYLVKSLNTNQKMELYNCGTNGDCKTLKELIDEKSYPLFEECSASGYFWTCLHYASHYGYVDIVEFYLKKTQNDPNKVDKLSMQSNLGLSPLFISLCNLSNLEKKKDILKLHVQFDVIDYKICSKNGEDIFKICQNQGLLEYFLSLLKED